MRPRSTARFVGFGIAVLLTLAAIVSFAIWQRTGSLSFNTATWKRDNYEAFSRTGSSELAAATRDRMVGDLLKRYRLIGMELGEIVTLLGKPDFRNKSPFQEWDMIYWLGPDSRGLAGALDFMWLVLKVDSSGKVTEYKVTYD